MTEQEYLKEKRKVLKLIDDGISKVMHLEMTAEEYFEIRKQWTDLINKAKQETWFRYI